MFCNGALVAIILKTGGIERLSVQQQVQEGDAMWYLIKRIVSCSLKITVKTC
jgi:hypothetical protein